MDETNNIFRRRRFDYYVGGRTLHFDGCTGFASDLLLGYCVEAYLKNAMVLSAKETPLTRGEEKAVSREHCVKRLFKYCQRRGFYDDVDVSDEFLMFIDDNYNIRYPSQEIKKNKELFDRYQAVVRGGAVLIYDDLIWKLDDSLVKKTNEPELSIGFIGLRHHDSVGFEQFFYCNPFAIHRLELFLSYFKNKSEQQTIRTKVEKYDFDAIEIKLALGVQLKRQEDLTEGLCNKFVYPRAQSVPQRFLPKQD